MEDNVLLVEDTWWKYKKTEEIGFITDVQKKKGLIIFRFFQSGHVGSFTNMEFLREFEVIPKSDVNTAIKNIGVTVDSIWKSNKTGDIVKVLIEPNCCDHCVHYINLNDTSSGHLTMSRVDKAVFITEYTFLRDNDNGALYRHNRNPNTYLKVIETTEKALMGAWMRFVKYRVIRGDSVEDGHECLIVSFHSCCHLLSLDPEKEWTVSTDSIRTIKAEENEMTKIPYGSLWVDAETGRDTIKVSFIASENGEIFVHYVNIVTGIERAEKLEEFVTVYKLLKDNDLSAIYERRDNPSEWVQVVICNPNSTCVNYHHYGGEFNGREDENDIANFHKQYKLITFYPTDADIESMKLHGITKESKMGNSKETYLNTDKSKMKEFSSGAKREDKSGKGRYDLIPGDIMADFVNYAWKEYFNEGPMTICDTDISLNAYFDDMTDEELFFEFILNMTCLFFTDHEKLDETTDCVGERSYVVTWDDFHKALYEMRELLAKHYEAGAKVHGVNNWKKGIPISDSERGGNFVDSMRRHTDQALRGLDDEPHAISAIWNAFAAIWTIRNKPANITNSSETKPEAEVKSEDREAEYLTLPSGRKIKIEFVHARTDYEKDIAFLNALRMDRRAINDIMKTLNKVNHPEDNQK